MSNVCKDCYYCEFIKESLYPMWRCMHPHGWQAPLNEDEVDCVACEHWRDRRVNRGKMTLNDYQSLAQRTANPALSVEQHLLNGALGLCGESGECADIVKKHMAQGHPLDREKLLDEVGDVLWYVAELAAALGVTLDDVAAHNIEKLRRRYPEGFSAERSIHREEYSQ